MMLAEENALETGRLGVRPGIEITIEMAQRESGIEMFNQLGRRRKELEDPRFDHPPAPAVLTPSQKRF
jgi:hypothetical protein